MQTNIFRIKPNDLIMDGYFYIGFIDYLLAGKKFYTRLFSPYDFKKNDKINLNYIKTINN